MRNHSTMTTLGCVALVTLGFALGIAHTPNETHAQQPGVMREHFVVVPGYTDSTISNPHYFVVSADGKAKEVKADTKPLLAPKSDDPNTTVKLNHSFNGQNNELDVRHSGRIQ